MAILTNIDPFLSDSPILNQHISKAREAVLGCDYIESEQNYCTALHFAKIEFGEHSLIYSLILLEVAGFYEQFGQDHDIYGILVELKSIIGAGAVESNSTTAMKSYQLTKFYTEMSVGLIAMRDCSFDKAELFFRDSISFAEETWGPYHPYVGIAYCFLTELFVIQGRKQEAEAADAYSNKILSDRNASNSY